MKPAAIRMLLACLLATMSVATIAAEKPSRWQAAMDRFAQQDREQAPPDEALLFIGSSSIRMWDLEESFGERPVINRGFGGSQYADILRHADRLIAPYDARAVVLYSGDNDVWAGKSPEQVRDDLAEVLRIIGEEQSEARVVVLGIKPSVARWKIREKIEEANRLMAEQVGKTPRATFIDTFPPLLDDQGQPRADLLLKDGLHLNAKGYAVWTPLVLEAIE